MFDEAMEHVDRANNLEMFDKALERVVQTVNLQVSSENEGKKNVLIAN